MSQRSIRAFLAGTLLAALPGLLHAAQPLLIEDLSLGPAPPQPVIAWWFEQAGPLTYFATFREVWRTDGTANGTFLLWDRCPGHCDGVPAPVGALGTRFLFSVSRSPSPYATLQQVWSTDGTLAGTRQITPDALQVLDLPAIPSPFADGELLFLGRRGGSLELWATDGTAAGTGKLAALPGSGSGVFIAALLGIGDRVFVVGTEDRQVLLWGTNVAADELPRLAAFPWPSVRSGVGPLFAAAGDRLLLLGAGAGGRIDLWASDGTAAGTGVVRGFPRARPAVGLQPGSQRAFFALEIDGRDRFIASDGTAAGTVSLAELATIRSIHRPGGATYLVADDGVHGMELWVHDGTAGGTRLVVDACPGSCSGAPVFMGRVGGQAVFQAVDPTEVRLFSARLGEIGATPLADLCPRECTRLVFEPDVDRLHRRLYFTRNGPEGIELWVTDATPAGTERVGEFPYPLSLSGAARSTGEISPPPFEPTVEWPAGFLGSTFLFLVHERGGPSRLWRSDGTAASTQEVRALTNPEERFGRARELTPFGGRLAYVADDPLFAPQVFLTDGTPGGAVALTDLPPPAGSSSILSLTPAESRLFFVHNPSEGGSELWVTEGTPESTRLVAVFPVFGLAPFGALGGEVLFFAPGLWKSDGTPAGTVPLTGPAMTVFSEFFRLGEALFFIGWEEGGLPGVWRTDGTPAGTFRILDTGTGLVFPEDLAVLGGSLFIIDRGQLWKSDGTAAGTEPVAGVELFADSVFIGAGGKLFFTRLEGGIPPPRGLWATDGSGPLVALKEDLDIALFGGRSRLHAFVGRHLYLTADGGEAGFELWRSDGTAAGTARVADLFPGPLSSHPEWLTPAGDALFFVTTDPVHGTEIWRTEGTAATTIRQTDTPSGRASLEPQELTLVSDRLFFAGAHPAAGGGLWALPPAASARCVADAEILCLRDGRFAVEARWHDVRSGTTGTGRALSLAGSDESGLFWFFSSDNVELIVKILDGRSVNDRFWVFSGGLSDVEYWVTVTDTETGAVRTYHNPFTEICGQADTSAFPEPLGLGLPGETPWLYTATAAEEAACTPSPTTLCLLDGRFRVEVDWSDQFNGGQGPGRAIPGTDQSGFFWFFSPENVELVVKALDGWPVNGRFWLFYGALTNVEYTITVTDTVTGAQNSYYNPPGELCGQGDTAAFSSEG